jgi:hypothetical protein
LRSLLLVALLLTAGSIQKPENVSTWWLYRNGVLAVSNDQKGAGKVIRLTLADEAKADTWELRYHLCGQMGHWRKDSVVMLDPDGKRLTAGFAEGYEHRISFTLKKSWFMRPDGATRTLRCSWNGEVEVCTFKME